MLLSSILLRIRYFSSHSAIDFNKKLFLWNKPLKRSLSDFKNFNQVNALSQNVAESHAAHSNVPTDVRIYFKIQIILKVLTFLALMNTTGVLFIFKSLHAMLLITISYTILQ